MSFTCLIKSLEFPQKNIPEWSTKVERWYQLDAYAFGLCEAFFHLPNKDFNSLILASPEASNETDFHFSHHSIASPQKFVHTLPNVRASVGLQAIGKKSPLICMQNSPYSMSSALKEFDSQMEEGKIPLLASVFPFINDYSLQSPKTYGVFLLTRDKKGDWNWSRNSEAKEELRDRDLQTVLFEKSNRKQLGPWVLEKVNG